MPCQPQCLQAIQNKIYLDTHLGLRRHGQLGLFFAAMALLLMAWDVYHSSFQTFGFGRIYDKLAGNDTVLGRRSDIALSFVMYAGPVLDGALLGFHASDFSNFEGLGEL